MSAHPEMAIAKQFCDAYNCWTPRARMIQNRACWKRRRGHGGCITKLIDRFQVFRFQVSECGFRIYKHNSKEARLGIEGLKTLNPEN